MSRLYHISLLLSTLIPAVIVSAQVLPRDPQPAAVHTPVSRKPETKKATPISLPGAEFEVLGDTSYNQGDFQSALEWYEQGAGKNNPFCLFKLGLMYRNGTGRIEKNPEKATDYFKKAHPGLQTEADRGQGKAQFELAVMYNNGYGLTKDESLALSWLRRSAESGYPNAEYSLGKLFFEGKQVDQSYLQAFEWYKKAADQGYAQAEATLGIMYEMGFGVPKSNAQALYWYKKGCAGGNKDACDNMKKL